MVVVACDFRRQWDAVVTVLTPLLVTADGTHVERLTATVQHYDWGDASFIARLQRRAESGLPEAELWMGAHPAAPSRLESTGESLAEVIASDPVAQLGDRTAARFGELPFLAKVLAAERPLSIQAHPSMAQAQAGFSREEAAGIARDSPRRIYRDVNHKPELICALTPFEAKCGFRSLDQTRQLFADLGGRGLSDLRALLASQGPESDILGEALAWLLRASDETVAGLVSAAVDAALDHGAGGPFARDIAWAGEIARLYPGDVGGVVCLLLNHVVLEPGQAIFLGAGNLHAYLRGAGIELMANSDNVVRCGLTSKHIDVEELLAVVDCAPTVAPIQNAAGCIHTFESPVAEFSLSRVAIGSDTHLQVDGPEIIVVTEGIVEFTTSEDQVIVPETGVPLWVRALDDRYLARGDGVFYRASVGRI